MNIPSRGNFVATSGLHVGHMMRGAGDSGTPLTAPIKGVRVADKKSSTDIKGQIGRIRSLFNKSDKRAMFAGVNENSKVNWPLMAKRSHANIQRLAKRQHVADVVEKYISETKAIYWPAPRRLSSTSYH